MKRGVPVSPGIAVAPAYCVDQVLARRETQQLHTDAVLEELRRFDHACALAAQELEGIAARVRRQVGETEAGIFRAQQLFLRDPALIARVHTLIQTRQIDAPGAVHEVLDEYIQFFAQVQDDYLRERLADLRDVFSRVLGHLTTRAGSGTEEPTDPVIVVAHEILPSQAMTLQRLKVAGILTETGGASGHAAILARALGIPAVSGINGLLTLVQSGDLVALDGREGHVYLRPGPEVEAAYRKLQREYVNLRERMIENRDQEAISADGTRVELLANVNGPADAVMAAQVGASGVGLYRTEYLFLTHPSVPDEEEQLAAYRAVVESAPNNRVTIRTLDLGGDKHVPYLGEARQTNPFMGWRSIRLSTAHPEFFQTQLRAILRAGQFGEVHLLFPMVSTVEEVHRLKRLVRQTEDSLRQQGIPYGRRMPIGVMIEVPAAALCIETLLREVDFVSIGSNDLIQYVMAADRDNPKVAHLCEPFNPAIMRLLRYIIRVCQEHRKPVTLCGEMAGRPRCFLPLFGMGLRRFSMSPGFVPSIKELVRCSHLPQARRIARRTLRLTTVEKIRSYLGTMTHEVCPRVSFLDTSK